MDIIKPIMLHNRYVYCICNSYKITRFVLTILYCECGRNGILVTDFPLFVKYTFEVLAFGTTKFACSGLSNTPNIAFQ